MDLEQNKETEVKQKVFIVDTAYFIQLKTPDSTNKYYTTKLVIDEIRDEKAREFYSLNKDSFIVRNPNKQSMKIIIEFSKKSNDLFNLSIPDLSVIALSYELSKQYNLTLNNNPLRNEPLEWIIKKKEKKEEKKEEQPDEEGFIEVKSRKKEEPEELDLWKDFGTDEDWINESNFETKLNKFRKVEDVLNNNDTSGIYLITDDYTIQNVCLKIGIKVLSVNGLLVRRVKNYLFKCLTCNKFNFDTTVQFCQECGYPTLMKVGFSVSDKGEGTIYDKDPDVRVRGSQFDLPKPTIGKRATIYVLCEDQLPKKRDYNIEKHLDKILDNYEQYKDLLTTKKMSTGDGQSTKNYEWGYPKKNPNVAKKYYGKKAKK